MPPSHEPPRPRQSLRIAAAAIPVLLTLALLFNGCSGTVDVSGTVTYRGQPVRMGTVSLIARDNVEYVGEIGPNGDFRIRGVPPGPVRIGVTSDVAHAPRPASRTGKSKTMPGHVAKAAPPEPVNPNPVPRQFSDPAQSGIAGVAGKGALKIDIR